ncbi:MAG: DUF3899 domain-containing protein [bacterium]
MQRFVKYIITAICGITIMFILFILRSTFVQSDSQIIMKDVTDAFCSAGMLLLCSGALVFVSNQGIFNMFTYSFKRFTSIFRSDETKKMNKLYYEYNRDQLASPSPMLHLFIIGALFLAIGLIFLLIYSNM